MKSRAKASEDSRARHVPPYAGRRAVLATMHGKEAAIAPILLDRLGLVVVTAQDLDTDAFGTFTGEVPRAGSMRDAAIAKARLGMAATGLPIGIASEGSYGPHPHLPLVPGGIELMVLVDDERHIVVSESLVEHKPVHAHAFASTGDGLGAFLERIGFPAHAVTVKAADPLFDVGPIFKGVRDREELGSAITRCAVQSLDGRALVQADMRAHMNPTRMASLVRLASAFAERVACMCPACGMPGFGQVDVDTGLPCAGCGESTRLACQRVFGCVACAQRETRPRDDGRTHADPAHCPLCNP